MVNVPPSAYDLRPQVKPLDAVEKRSIWLALPGLFASLLCHAVLVLWAVGLFDGAEPLAAVPIQSIAVDLVPDVEANRAEDSPKAPDTHKQQNPAADPLRFSSVMPPPPAPVPAMPSPAVEPPTAQEMPDTGDSGPLANRLADALHIPITLSGGDGDTTASDTKAKLEKGIVAEFKTHLSKCWIAPPRGSDAARLKVVIRVMLKRDGTFFKEPMLIQAVASAGGPVLVKSAMSALWQCQPYSFLPPEQYKEWRELDLVFSPQGIL